MISKRKKRRTIRIISIILIILAMCIALSVYFLVRKYFFLGNTYVQDVNLSHLTVKGANKKIWKELQTQYFVIKFNEQEKYLIYGMDIQMTILNNNELEQILEEQHESSNYKKETYFYSLSDSLAFNKNSVCYYFQKILDERMKNGYIQKSENAYLRQTDDGLLEIVPEVYGNEVIFDDALGQVIDAIKSNQKLIDLEDANKVLPQVTTSSLQENMEQVNAVLQSNIEFQLSGGNVYVLDINTMKDWVSKSDDGTYSIQLENLSIFFADQLVYKAIDASETAFFNATDLDEPVLLSLPRNKRDVVDRWKTADLLKEVLSDIQESATPKSIELEPVYISNLDSHLNNYIELDITRQTLWFYKNGECIVEAPCVTGNVSNNHSTPTGVYVIDKKVRNTYLSGFNSDGTYYSSFVNYWMPFKGYIGLHDATWRKNFGDTIYLEHGSHGCVNLPFSEAKTIFENIDYSTWSIIYCS